MSTTSLYQRVLGPEFQRLPPVLRKFHGRPEGGYAGGTIQVASSGGALRRAAACALGLPAPGEEVPLRLQVVPREGTEVWTRHFGRRRLETVQWQDGPFLVEKTWPLCLVFRLEAGSEGLRFHLLGNHMLNNRRLALPPGCPVRVGAYALGAGDHWHIGVDIGTPLPGVVTTYRGEIYPGPC